MAVIFMYFGIYMIHRITIFSSLAFVEELIHGILEVYCIKIGIPQRLLIHVNLIVY